MGRARTLRHLQRNSQALRRPWHLPSLLLPLPSGLLVLRPLRPGLQALSTLPRLLKPVPMPETVPKVRRALSARALKGLAEPKSRRIRAGRCRSFVHAHGSMASPQMMLRRVHGASTPHPPSPKLIVLFCRRLPISLNVIFHLLSLPNARVCVRGLPPRPALRRKGFHMSANNLGPRRSRRVAAPLKRHIPRLGHDSSEPVVFAAGFSKCSFYSSSS